MNCAIAAESGATSSNPDGAADNKPIDTNEIKPTDAVDRQQGQRTRIQPAIEQQSITDEDRGLSIALEADRRESGFGDTLAELTMTLGLPNGDQVKREMRQLTLEVEGDGNKLIMVFDKPRDLTGTAILTHTHKVDNDDQWLYLPALKRVKRISSSDRSGPFMGSEFAYEDLSSDEVEKYTYRYLGEDIIDGDTCFVIERIPVNKKSGYTRQTTWVDQHEYRLRKVDYYDRKGDLLKTMELSDHQHYLDRYWRASKMEMTNHQTGKSTILEFRNYQFRVGLDSQDFSRGALSRIR